jgi:hypothetical protein
MHWVNLGLPAGNNSTHGSDQDLNRLGFWLGAAAQSNSDQGPDFAPPESDLLTAEHLGERVARVTQQFVRGRLPAVEGLWSEMSCEAHHDRVLAQLDKERAALDRIQGAPDDRHHNVPGDGYALLARASGSGTGS